MTSQVPGRILMLMKGPSETKPGATSHQVTACAHSGLLRARAWGRQGDRFEPALEGFSELISSVVLCAIPVFCLPGSFPHPLGSLLNRVIIFKQINSIAKFFLSNDEFAAQMPLILLTALKTS